MDQTLKNLYISKQSNDDMSHIIEMVLIAHKNVTAH